MTKDVPVFNKLAFPKQLKTVSNLLRSKYTAAHTVLVSLKTGPTWTNNKNNYHKLSVLLEDLPYAPEAGKGPNKLGSPGTQVGQVGQVSQARNDKPHVLYKTYAKAAAAGNVKAWKAAYALLMSADAETLLLAVPLDCRVHKCWEAGVS